MIAVEPIPAYHLLFPCEMIVGNMGHQNEPKEVRGKICSRGESSTSTLKMDLFLLMDYWLAVPNSLDILPKMQVIRALSKRWCLASPSEQRRDVDPRSLPGGMGLELDDGGITSSHGLEDGSVHKL